MLVTTQVRTLEELQQIHILNQQNLRQNISPEERNQEGFVAVFSRATGTNAPVGTEHHC
jgi:hypothetical protein